MLTLTFTLTASATLMLTLILTLTLTLTPLDIFLGRFPVSGAAAARCNVVPTSAACHRHRYRVVVPGGWRLHRVLPGPRAGVRQLQHLLLLFFRRTFIRHMTHRASPIPGSHALIPHRTKRKSSQKWILTVPTRVLWRMNVCLRFMSPLYAELYVVPTRAVWRTLLSVPMLRG